MSNWIGPNQVCRIGTLAVSRERILAGRRYFRAMSARPGGLLPTTNHAPPRPHQVTLTARRTLVALQCQVLDCFNAVNCFLLFNFQTFLSIRPFMKLVAALLIPPSPRLTGETQWLNPPRKGAANRCSSLIPLDLDSFTHTHEHKLPLVILALSCPTSP